MLKLIAKQNGFIDGTYRVKGEIFYSKVCPPWAEIIEGGTPVENPKEPEVQNEPQEKEGENTPDDNPAGVPVDEVKEDNTPDDGTTPDEFEGKTEQEIQMVLDDLINQGIEKGILLDDAGKLSVREQIAELRKLLDIKEV